MRRDKRDGRCTIAARVVALGDALLAVALSLLTVDVVLPRRAARRPGEVQRTTGAEPDPGGRAGGSGAQS